MTRRSRAREIALQLLFQRDVNREAKRATIDNFVVDRLPDKTMRPFCIALFDGVFAHRKEIDERLALAADNWRVNRMAAVDRNVLRLAAFEMIYMPDPTPGPVALNEAIELARRFGSADSPGFVNGVLDRLYRAHAAEIARTTAAAATPPSAESAP